jgi:hypothetical protein
MKTVSENRMKIVFRIEFCIQNAEEMCLLSFKLMDVIFYGYHLGNDAHMNDIQC